MMKSVKAVFAVALCAFLFCGCAYAGALDKDVLVIGTSPTYPPYETIDEKGNLTGFDIELMEMLAETIGKKMEWKQMPFDSLLPTLMAGRIDAVIAGLSRTDERAKKVDFSKFYDGSKSAFVVKVDNNDIKSLADMKGKKIATQIGTVQETWLLNCPETKDGVVHYQKFDDCMLEVTLGRVDATLMDEVAAKNFAKKKDFQGKTKIAFINRITDQGKALAFTKGDPEFVKAINDAIDTLKANGKMSALFAKWEITE